MSLRHAILLLVGYVLGQLTYLWWLRRDIRKARKEKP